MTGISAASRRPQDLPRSLSPRELSALTFIGEGFEVAQYQMHAAVFGCVSETVVSRFVRRMAARGIIATDRLHGFGFNRLRLTRRGREILLSSGDIDETRIFAPRTAVALKDLAHTLIINDLRVVFRALSNPPTVLLPAWTLARRDGGLRRLVPDLLAIWPNITTQMACEVDLGSEPLTGVFQPKLRSLVDAMATDRAKSGVLVLTRGRRRTELLRQFGSTIGGSVPLMTFAISGTLGPAGLEEIRATFDEPEATSFDKLGAPPTS